MHDQRAAVAAAVEQLLEADRVGLEARARGSVAEDQQRWHVAGMGAVRLARRVQMPARGGERRDALPDAVHVEAVEARGEPADVDLHAQRAVRPG